MATTSNVDLVNILDPEDFTVATTLAELSLMSRRAAVNKKILGENLPALIATQTAVLGTFTGTTIPDNVSIKAGLQALETAVEGVISNTGTTITYQSFVSSRLKIEATAGVTAAFASGVVTITIPLNGVFKSGSFDFTTSDATYANSLITAGIKVRFVNTTNSVAIASAPYVMSRSSSGAVSASNPLQYNTSINLAIVSDEYDASGISSWVLNQVGSNAPAGGFIYF